MELRAGSCAGKLGKVSQQMDCTLFNFDRSHNSFLSQMDF